MSIIYEVNISLQREIETDYRGWLEKHIAEILALPGFIDAQSFDVQQVDGSDTIAICVQYRLESLGLNPIKNSASTSPNRQLVSVLRSPV